MNLEHVTPAATRLTRTDTNGLVPAISGNNVDMDIARVGRRVAKRREELRLDAAPFARLAGIDPKTLASLERGERWPRPSSRGGIEAALGWQPGSLGDILEGREPTPLDTDQPSPDVEDESVTIHAARYVWESVNALAESSPADPARVTKANTAVIATADYLTDVLLGLNAGPKAKSLIQEMSRRAFELLQNESGHADRTLRAARIEDEPKPNAE